MRCDVEVGIDIIEIDRIIEAMKNEKFVLKVFTENEREWLRGKSPQSYAGIFAAKEALVKAGGGVLSDYEIGHEESGKPIAEAKCPGEFKISISHCESYATAVAIKI
jgi:phosphopantetheine--protein transferase-like protein